MLSLATHMSVDCLNDSLDLCLLKLLKLKESRFTLNQQGGKKCVIILVSLQAGLCFDLNELPLSPSVTNERLC